MKFSSEIEKDITMKYKTGISSIKLGEIYDVNSVTIRNIIKRNGGELRTRSQAMSNCNNARKYSFNENYFIEPMNENKAYILGLLFSDGNVYKKDYKIGFGSKDIELVEFIRKELESDNPIYKRKDYTMYEINLYSKVMYESLVKFGCVDNKSHILEFPIGLDEEFYPHFIRGMWDGDGCVRNNKGTIVMDLVGSKNILEDILKILAKITGSKTKVSKHSTVFRITFNGNKNCKKLYEYLYFNSTLYLGRKRKILEDKFD